MGLAAFALVDGGVLLGGVGGELAADEAGVPGPVVFGVGCGVNAGVAAAGLDVGLEGLLLFAVENIHGGGEEDDAAEALELGAGESGGVLGGFHREAVLGAELFQCGDAVGDRVVAEAGGLGEDQDRLGRFDARQLRCGGGEGGAGVGSRGPGVVEDAAGGEGEEGAGGAQTESEEGTLGHGESPGFLAGRRGRISAGSARLCSHRCGGRGTRWCRRSAPAGRRRARAAGSSSGRPCCRRG
ncbi:MAG: hypothetical protein RL095_24 [Verrucomicrobiota bacterium]